MTTTILAVLGATVLILQTATRLPPALAEFLRSCQTVRDALHELRTRPAIIHRISRPNAPESIGVADRVGQ